MVASVTSKKSVVELRNNVRELDLEIFNKNHALERLKNENSKRYWWRFRRESKEDKIFGLERELKYLKLMRHAEDFQLYKAERELDTANRLWAWLVGAILLAVIVYITLNYLLY